MAAEKKSLNVALGPELIAYVNNQVGSGLYNNQSEVVRAALRQQQRGEKLDEALARLNEMIALGLAQVSAGQFVSARESDSEIEAMLAEAEAAEKAAARPETRPTSVKSARQKKVAG